MLLSKVYAPVLFMFSMQPFASANPVPDQNVNSVRSTSKLEVMGKLQILEQVQTRFVSAREDKENEEDEEDESRMVGLVDPLDRKVTPYGPGPDQNEALRLHNVVRDSLGLGLLNWDSDLEAKAKAWAIQLAKIKQLKIQNLPNLGENVAYRFSTEPTKDPIALATKGWLDTKFAYRNETIPKGNFTIYAPYTQCIWKKTTQVGIAAASDGKGTWYVVGYYSPAGNVYGYRPY